MDRKKSGAVEENASSKLYTIGLWLTGGYFVTLILAIGLLSILGWFEWKGISLNEVGDFLAGAFSPVAFFWLILGFRQQGHELRLQVTELANSVAQQKEMVEISRMTLLHAEETVAAERRKYEPNLFINIVRTSRATRRLEEDEPPVLCLHYRLEVTNVGCDLSDVRISYFPRPLVVGATHFAALAAEGSIELNFDIGYEDEEDAVVPERIEVSCMTANGNRHSLSYEVVDEGYFPQIAPEVSS